MEEFACAHSECGGQFTSHDRSTLRKMIGDHLRDVHNVQVPTQTLVGYLEATAVTKTEDR
jgi:hypothetical protein